MSKSSLCLERGMRLFEDQLSRPDRMPFSFRYGDKQYTGLKGLKAVCESSQDGPFIRRTWTACVRNALRITFAARFDSEYGECEYTVYFKNISARPGRVLSDIQCLDASFGGTRPVLRGCLGDHQNYYADYEHDLSRSDRYFTSVGGRATHISFPYFDLVHGNGGTLIALGWAGTWEALFARTEKGVHVQAQSCLDLNAALLPGEEIRTALVVLLPYSGRDRDGATNLWREWFLQHNMPRYDASGRAVTPFTTACWANDTGLPNSDGSISERSTTWRATLDKLVKENAAADFRWFDAGWYPDPAGNTVETDWWGTIGRWEIDREKWPGDSFRQSNDACHAVGMKVLVWFEPERVTHVEDLARTSGYRPEWSIGTGSSRTNDLGDPDCLAWTLRRITDFMDEHGVDLYREDNNSDPARDWPARDRELEQKTGLPRRGITENKCICGHYALWDGILTHCAETGKLTFLDSCASGGGRNDIESLRRGVPFMRSDYDRTTISMRLSQSSSLPRWIPFHGSSTKETLTQLGSSEGRGSDSYASRASWLPIYNYCEAFTHNPLLDYDLLRTNIAEWRSVSQLLMRDMYILTPWHHDRNRTMWTAFAYHDPEADEAVLLAFRPEESRRTKQTFRLSFPKSDVSYRVTNADTGDEIILTGDELKRGCTVTLPSKRSCAFFRIVPA